VFLGSCCQLRYSQSVRLRCRYPVLRRYSYCYSSSDATIEYRWVPLSKFIYCCAVMGLLSNLNSF
jgi:hypothetical protein